jgi:enoyl-CoA hydratase/carnithine racemase
MSARLLDGAEAHRIGLVDHVAPSGEALQAAVQYAADLAVNCSPASMADIKRQVYGDMERNLDESVGQSLEAMENSLKRSDSREGVVSFLERRAPNFAALESQGW